MEGLHYRPLGCQKAKKETFVGEGINIIDKKICNEVSSNHTYIIHEPESCHIPKCDANEERKQSVLVQMIENMRQVQRPEKTRRDGLSGTRTVTGSLIIW